MNKHVPSFDRFVNEQEEMLNEDALNIALLIFQAAMVGGNIAMMSNLDDFRSVNSLKNWWNRHKKDKAVQSIIDKLKNDQDVIEFLQMSRSKQRGQWKSLIAPKLNTGEMQYINSISRDRVNEGTFNSSKEVAIYSGDEGLTHIEKRGSGYYGYNDEFDFTAKDKKELEQMLKKWRYTLISGSL